MSVIITEILRYTLPIVIIICCLIIVSIGFKLIISNIYKQINKKIKQKDLININKILNRITNQFYIAFELDLDNKIVIPNKFKDKIEWVR